MHTSLDHVPAIPPGGDTARQPFRLAGFLVATVVALLGLWQGFFFLRDSTAPRLVVAGLAVVWAGGGLSLFFFLANRMIEHLPLKWAARLQPFVFVGPAIAMVAYYLALPTVRTFIASLFDRDGSAFVGLANYVTIFTQRFMLETFRNNLMWIVFGASLTVVAGLVIATLADRSRFERLAKAIVFMPMAISLVGAGIIWKFVYAVRDVSDPQIGLLNALVVAFGGEPQAWIAQLQPWNNLFLIVIVVWLQTGFAMVLFRPRSRGAGRGPRGGAGRRCRRTPHLLPDPDPFDQGDDHHRHRNRDDLHPEDLRRGHRHDRRPVWDRCDRDAVLQPVFCQPELRAGLGDRRRAPRHRLALRRLQSAAVPPEGGVVTGSLRRPLPHVIVNGTLILVCLLWLLPTFGLFVSSFRTATTS